MKKYIKYSLLTIGILLIIGLSGFYIWTQQTYEPSGKLQELVGEVEQEDGWVVYEPEDRTKGGVVLYPGAKVEPEAYSYLAQQLSDQGYVVGIPHVALNLAFTGIGKSEELMERYPSVEKWYVGGHSLGGVAAASYAHENLHKVDGLFFLGSYPAGGDDFSKEDLPVLSIYAEKDGLTSLEDIEKSKSLLPENAVFYEVTGGNHAQFGMYGPQKGDNKAELPAKEQQDQIIQAMIDWIQ
ncbi:alpha/beta hydrolase [Rossellomorea aquimaris]|uniref:alpha/beta hydrolase n=1 Tax=Rossellomorea aquimaris TaxID=189382 RepID=UPI001CD1FE5F|nr:alpha/beta hydrolase [Rossellomorea aquimaris]MCA1054037.1 alpha/beta hydrolase [Rossellomorea aquimaris]